MTLSAAGEARLTDPDGNEVRVGSPLREPKPAGPA
jgi:hypothetical protein